MKTLFTIFALFFVSICFAQTPQIVRQNGSDVEIYSTNSLADVLLDTNPGDTIYLPNGSFGTATINRKVVIFGVGHDPESTAATFSTQMTSLILAAGAEESIISGLSLTNLSITAGNTDIRRCHISTIGYGSNLANGGSLRECIIYTRISGNGVSNLNMSNCIFHTANTATNTANLFIKDVKNSIFQNNILMNYWRFGFQDITDCVFNNNYIIGYNNNEITNCLFNNNIFSTNVNFPNGSNNGADNLSNLTVNATFEDVNETMIRFLYTNDYNLRNASPGKGAGLDGTDIGIFGGAFPFKVGSTPRNPHISEKDIPFNLTTDGKLPVKITVEAQDY